MKFWKRFYIVRETKRLMSTLPITKTPVSYLYFQIERIDFYRMKYRFILEKCSPRSSNHNILEKSKPSIFVL